MIAYIIRRLLYAVPIVLGIVLITFVLFFVVNTPQDMARRTLGPKATPDAIADWVRAHGYDLPLVFNRRAEGVEKFTSTLLFQKCARVLVFDLGRSDATGRLISAEIARRMWPSLAFAVPSFLIGLVVYVSTSLIIAFCRGTYLDRGGTVLCVLMMSISSLFYIIGGQFLLAKWLRLFPISGFDWGGSTAKFVFLPVVISVVAGIGGSVRFYRTVMLEEVGRDYVRTARAKGLGEAAVMFRHVLKNAMIPILTNAVMAIPFLFMGSLIMESFFAIPGLGSMTITAIHAQDFAVIRAMTYIGSLLYIAGLLMTDVSYTLVDPRITLGAGGSRTLYGGSNFADAAKILLAFAALGGGAVGLYYAVAALSRLTWRVPVVSNAGVLLAGAGFAAFVIRARRSVLWRGAWRQVRRSRTARVSTWVILAYVLVGVMDSITWRDVERPAGAGRGAVVLSRPRSMLDRLCEPLIRRTEKTYSAPLAATLLSKETVQVAVAGRYVRLRRRPALKFPHWHLLGTDKTGQDVLYVTLKGARTGLIVGGLTTLIAVPFAVFFGVVAGFFGGWIDDVVQYVYSTLSCIPWVLLVVCFMLVFGQGLVQLCVVMGITGWVGLCRLLRGETLKLREKQYVQAALALGVSRFKIILRHIVPNVMHLVLISIVLRFSGLVLAEAVLSYIGVGVGPETFSWGSMINQARGELGRDPVVWWNLAGAFVAMVGLVLPANLFGDALRDALDPSLRVRGGAGESA
ncbi:MAG: ABC transporter permease subunit [Planctomycetes bacterium]|nr:ABC transporter permease subunit [Planctomycetota bacterium]